MLQSMRTFSTDYAWGLATPNPMTIYTLEKATRRNVDLSCIEKERELLKDIQVKFKHYLPKDIHKLEYKKDSLLDTKFNIINFANRYIKKYEKVSKRKWVLGEYKKGCEWLALTFQNQQQLPLTTNELDSKIEYDSKQIQDAYSRMKIDTHNWAKGGEEEINFILNFLEDKNIDIQKDSYVYDFGCGNGRHCNALYKKGFVNVTGYDYAIHNINNNIKNNINFEILDISKHNLELNKKASLILCLYDVVGSSYDDNVNDAVLKNIYNNLSNTGVAVVSVMNMDYTLSLKPNMTDNLKENPIALQNLPARNIMESTGEVFNPKYILIDTSTPHLVYRKEQFEQGSGIPVEYIIVDRRYKKEEIENITRNIGFKVLHSAYVSAGHFEKSYNKTDNHAKEILLILQK